MFGPGAYRPDPSEGMTATADLPQPEIVPYSRNDKRNVCPRCGHVAGDVSNLWICYPLGVRENHQRE